MHIVAISPKGREFVYYAESAHRVAKGNARKIADALNAAGYRLQDGETWSAHEIDRYDRAAGWADLQAFTLHRDGRLTERRPRW